MTSLNKGRFRLSDMELDFVSLVPAGDDPLAQVVIAKAAPDKCEGNGPPVPTLSSTPLTEEKAVATINKSDLAPEVVAYIDGLEAEVDTLSSQVEKGESDIETLKTDIEDLRGTLAKSAPKDAEAQEEITKSLLAKADPAVRALFEQQQAAIKKSEDIAKAEREARLEREFLSKAEALPMVGEDKQTLAGLLRRMADSLTPEDNAEVEKMLKSANEHIAKSGLFAEFGNSGAETTISKSLVAKAEALVKADPSLTIEQAQVKIMESDPAFASALLNGEDA